MNVLTGKLVRIVPRDKFFDLRVNGMAFIYAFFISSFPFETIFGVGFSDRENYISNYFNIYSTQDSHFGDSPLQWILSESLWSFSLFYLSNIFSSISVTLTFISFFSAFIVCRYTLAQVPNVYIVAFFLNPLMIDFFISQSRMSFAFAVFLLLFPSSNIFIKLFFTFLSATIHFSLLVIAPFLAFKDQIYKYFFRNSNVLLIIFLICIFLLIYKSLNLDLLLILYAAVGYDFGRSDEYIHLVAGSLKYLSIWILYLFFAFLSGRAFLYNSSSFVALFLISSFIIFDLARMSGIRLLPVAYPFFLISLQYLPTRMRLLYIYIFSFYIFLYWLYWVQAF